MFTPLPDATTLAERVRRREVHPRELVAEAIARIESLNPTLGAVTTQLFDRALTEASGPLPDGPFTGVPFLVKDLLATVADVAQTSGSHFLRGHIAPRDSELVARFRRAGLLIVGRTNTPEFGLAPTTEPIATGPTRNPWNTTLSAGGSSGGSAAAVAAGMVPMAHGNDGGGSIRVPASCCGLFGLKPTRGRNPMGSAVADEPYSLVVEHALTVSVRDSAALLDATQVESPVGKAIAQLYTHEVTAAPGRLRVAFSNRPLAGTPVHPACVAAVHDTAALLASLGHEVFERDLAVTDPPSVDEGFVILWARGAAASVDAWTKTLGRSPAHDDIEPMTRALCDLGRSIPRSRYLRALADLQRASREIQRHFASVDIWLTPTLAMPPVALGALAATVDNPLAGFYQGMIYCPFTPMWNITGQPAMSVPLHWSPEGLPIGSHFVGRYGDEATLFRLAGQLEAARPWARCRSAVHVSGTDGV